MGINGFKELVKAPQNWQSTGPGGNSLNIPPREQQRSEIEEFAHRPTTAERLMGLEKLIDYSSNPEGFTGSTPTTTVRSVEPQSDQLAFTGNSTAI